MSRITWATQCLTRFSAQPNADNFFFAKQEKHSDEEFQLNSDESENDDEETIDQAEREEVGQSRDQELQELEAEKDMPLEKLLARYGSSVSQIAEEEVEEERAEEMNDSEGLTSESEMEFEEDYSNQEANDVKEGLGIESLLGDSLASQGAATSKLSDAAALAESFQPKGNTLESTKVNVNPSLVDEISTLGAA